MSSTPYILVPAPGDHTAGGAAEPSLPLCSATWLAASPAPVAMVACRHYGLHTRTSTISSWGDSLVLPVLVRERGDTRAENDSVLLTRQSTAYA